MPRIGYLFSLTQSEGLHLWEACRQGLRELGYVEGQNIIVEPRWAEGRYERLPGLVADLERLKIDVMVAAATPTNMAVKASNGAIPVVFVAVADPFRAGLIASLSRPGGRFTGLSLLTPEMSGKRLELLAETVRDPVARGGPAQSGQSRQLRFPGGNEGRGPEAADRAAVVRGGQCGARWNRPSRPLSE